MLSPKRSRCLVRLSSESLDDDSASDGGLGVRVRALLLLLTVDRLPCSRSRNVEIRPSWEEWVVVSKSLF